MNQDDSTITGAVKPADRSPDDAIGEGGGVSATGGDAAAAFLASSTLHPCAHCGGTGTCRNGLKQASCDACARTHAFLFGKPRVGLACGTCRGLGQTSTEVYQLQQKATPYLAIAITACSFLLILIFGFAGNWTSDDYFTEVLAFCTTLLGTVTGYYFSSRNQSRT